MPLVLVLAGAVVGPGALGFIDVSVTAADVERITETTLALLLFADAATLDLGEVRKDTGLPARLLLIGMPLTVLLGAAAAIGLFPAEGLGFALLIGAILAPTDAALGLPIFTDRRVPVRIRRALNIESGLNDGIATPLVTLFLALAIEEQQAAQGWLLGALSGMGWGRSSAWWAGSLAAGSSEPPSRTGGPRPPPSGSATWCWHSASTGPRSRSVATAS